MPAETIVAQSTPPGYSGLAVIRMSGPECYNAVKKTLGQKEIIPNRMKFGRFMDPQTKEIVDSLNFAYLKGPKSSTGEDMLELFPHGNPLISDRIIQILCRENKVRMALPGEFTRKSLENGKIDVLQAEAIGALIHSKNLESLRNAVRIMEGTLSHPLRMIKKEIEEISMRLELDVDFSEEEADPDHYSWKKRIIAIKKKLSDLANSWNLGRRLGLEPVIAVFGAPNAGKSSLINSIVSQDRLIVSELPGTTRDYVEVPVNLRTGRVLLVDTAGIGNSDDVLKICAEEKTHQVLNMADFKILVVDGVKSGISEYLKPERYDLKVFTKSDLPEFIKIGEGIAVSNKTGEGITELRNYLERKVFKAISLKDGETVISTSRQFHCIETALRYINNAEKLFESDPAVELLAFELKEARNSMSELLGDYNSEETLNKIFAKFCIGK